MNVIKTEIPEVLIIEPSVFGDVRGYFFESFSVEKYKNILPNINFVQDNESKSTYGVLRGLHYQLAPKAQSKLVRVVSGRVLDVAVDMRADSPTFGLSVAVELSAENKRQLYIPRGFAHGFVVLSEEAVFQYKCDNTYSPECEASVAWDDATLNINWAIPLEDILLSEKDKKSPSLSNAKLFDYNEQLY